MSKKNLRLESLVKLSEIISPSNNREKIKQYILSNSIDWLNIVEIANMHFLTATLYYSLLHKDLLTVIDDEELLHYLEEIYSINLKRNQKIIEQSREIADILSKKDIKPVFLKGTASLLQNDYKDVGMRFLSDIDLCIDENSLYEASELLINAGYIEGEEKSLSPNWMHLPAMYHEKWDMVIELHRYVLLYQYSPIIPCKRSNYQKSKNDNNIYILTPTYRLVHAYIHSELVDRHYYTKTIDLRQLYEMAILIHNYKDEINWVIIEKVLKEHHLYKKFNHTINIVIKLFHMEIPEVKNKKLSKVHVGLRLSHFDNLETLPSNIFIGYQQFKHALSKTVIERRYGAVSKKDHFYFVLKHVSGLLKKHYNRVIKS